MDAKSSPMFAVSRLGQSSDRSLEVPVDVEEEVRAARGHVTLDGDLASGAERNDRVVGPDKARTEVDRTRERSRSLAGIGAQVALFVRQHDGEVDRDGS